MNILLIFAIVRLTGAFDTHYIAIASDGNHPVFQLLNDTFNSKGLKLHLLGCCGVYEGNGVKAVETKAFVDNPSLADDDVIVHIDAYDVVFLGDHATVLERYLAFNYPIVFSAERNCWPDKNKSVEYPAAVLETDFPFLNSGGFIGRVGAFRQLLAEDELSRSWRSDQRYWTRKYLENPNIITLDNTGTIFLTLVKVSRRDTSVVDGVYRYRDQTPQFVHGNSIQGKVDLALAKSLAMVKLGYPPNFTPPAYSKKTPEENLGHLEASSGASKNAFFALLGLAISLVCF